jgi:hypothetical protein
MVSSANLVALYTSIVPEILSAVKHNTIGEAYLLLTLYIFKAVL